MANAGKMRSFRGVVGKKWNDRKGSKCLFNKLCILEAKEKMVKEEIKC